MTNPTNPAPSVSSRGISDGIGETNRDGVGRRALGTPAVTANRGWEGDGTGCEKRGPKKRKGCGKLRRMEVASIQAAVLEVK